ncbi:AAEL010039-PA [Aedes aegypti]|uniref:AAEL010039-PA n=1 Tax=Aedes aegypti TaxID=7159 RepID=Q16U29_AEDAE|nr:AAEL010039-PA [Aedes aegypti]
MSNKSRFPPPSGEKTRESPSAVPQYRHAGKKVFEKIRKLKCSVENQQLLQ